MALVLIVDDDPSVRAVVRAWLKQRGMDVLVVDSGPAGIDHLATCAVDLAIIDIYMPEMNGLRIIRRLGQAIPSVPVIAMSEVPLHGRRASAPDFLGMAGRLGAAFCLRKPCRPEQLTAAIEACLDAPRAGHDEPMRQSSPHALIEISSEARVGREPGQPRRVAGVLSVS
jgi:CheY-like chemotaxis protein